MNEISEARGPHVGPKAKCHQNNPLLNFKFFEILKILEVLKFWKLWKFRKSDQKLNDPRKEEDSNPSHDHAAARLI